MFLKELFFHFMVRFFLSSRHFNYWQKLDMRGSSSKVSFVHQCSGMRITYVLRYVQCLMSHSSLFHGHRWRFLTFHSGSTFSVSILKNERNIQWWLHQSTLFSSLQDLCRIKCFINNARVTGEGWRQIICIRPRDIYLRGIYKDVIYPVVAVIRRA